MKNPYLRFEGKNAQLQEKHENKKMLQTGQVLNPKTLWKNYQT